VIGLATWKIVALALVGTVVTLAIIAEVIGAAWSIGQFVGDVIEGLREWRERRHRKVP
jgi:hypothetical protein